MLVAVAGRTSRAFPRRNFRWVVGVLFEDVRLDTPLPEDLSVDRLMATTAGKLTNLALARPAGATGQALGYGEPAILSCNNRKAYNITS